MPFRPLKALLNAGNFGDVLSGVVSTTDATATAIASYPLPTNSVVQFSATFVGRRTDDASGDGVVLTLSCAYKNVAGVLTQIGADSAARPFTSTSLNTAAASSATSGTSVSLRVAGVAATSVSWVLENATTIIAQ